MTAEGGNQPGPRVSDADDLDLLARFEPIVRFTAGELFLPTAVEGYVEWASLWETTDGRSMRCLIDQGDLTVERLANEARGRVGAELSMRFVDAPLGRRGYRDWRRRPDRPAFHTRGRFTQVGILARFLDALFRIGLLVRGRVPGGLAAAAEQTYRQRLDPRRHPYYGRVVRDGGYVAVQYWFFYAMNDWRSTFGGANDHEADWEQVTVYLVDDPDGGPRPAWVAYSAHDEVGDDLRRRWDDPELVRDGTHPVVFAGAGSHAGAFVAGEYVTAVKAPPSLRRVFGALRTVAQIVTPWSRGEIARGVGVPFVEYSRGDGVAIGPGQERAWSPVLIDDATPWVRDYRGLWGLDTRDRFGGERAPAGPRYERSGEVRQSWHDPVGWAGLHKVPATSEESDELLRRRVEAIDAEMADRDLDIDRGRHRLRALNTELSSLRDRPGWATTASELRSRIRADERALLDATTARAQLTDERAAHLDTLTHPRPAADPQAHLRRKAVPLGDERDERDRLLRVWSTISGPLLFLAAAFLVIDQGVGVVVGVTSFAVVFLAIEAFARRRLVAFVLTLIGVALTAVIALAAVEGVFSRWRPIIAAGLAVFAAVILLANLRDLRRGR